MSRSDAQKPAPPPPSICDVGVIGAGIIGLAVAREIALRNPRQTVCVFERESEIGAHQTGHNSGVVHAGIYYQPGSLKADLCVRGSRELYEYCENNSIAYERCGKLIIAHDATELSRLDELERRGRANGVEGLRRLDSAGIREIEPHAAGIAGLYSGSTGIVDFHAVAQGYARDFKTAGGILVTGCEVQGVSDARRSVQISHRHGVTEAGRVVSCGGAWADRLAVAAGADPDPRIVPFRGAYLQLVPERRDLVRSLIYPVPDPSLPFLGVHFTRRIDGEVLIGPTALLAGARDAYSVWRVRGRDLRDTLSWPGSWRMFRRWWRTGATELRHAASRSTVVAEASRYVPEITAADVTSSFAGVRAQAIDRKGWLVDDFVFSASERVLHVRNAPSPGATSSLAIARHIVDEAERLS